MWRFYLLDLSRPINNNVFFYEKEDRYSISRFFLKLLKKQIIFFYRQINSKVSFHKESSFIQTLNIFPTIFCRDSGDKHFIFHFLWIDSFFFKLLNQFQRHVFLFTLKNQEKWLKKYDIYRYTSRLQNGFYIICIYD